MDIRCRAPARLRLCRLCGTALIRLSHSAPERTLFSIQNPGRSMKSTPIASLLQCIPEQISQFLESAFGLGFVMDGAVRRGPTVISAFVYFALVSIATRVPGFERTVELFNRLLRHAVVIDGVREIKSRLDARQDQMRACGAIGEKSYAVE